MAFKMKNPSMAKLTKAAGDNRVAMKMKMESAAKMKKEAAMKMKKESMAKLKEKAAMKMKKSPMEKELVGNQKNLNEGLKKAIEAAPSKMKKGEPMKMKKGEPMKMKKESSMKMGHKSATKLKKPSPAKQKMNMVKGPDGKMVPDFAVDGKGANDMKSGAKMKDDSPVKKTYSQAWNDMTEAQKSKFESKEDFISKAKRYNQKKYGTTEPTKAADKFTGGDRKELEKLAKPKKIARREGGEKGNKLAKVTTPRKPSTADQITTAKKEGGRSARKIAAAERKMRKAAGDTSKRGDRKRRKAAKKLGKAGVESPMTMVKAVRKEQKPKNPKGVQQPALKNNKVKPVKQTGKKLRKPSVTAKF